MSFNGSGTYVLPVNSLSPDATAGTTIVSDDFDELTASLETALTLCFPHDGQRTATGNFKMGSNKITGLADGTALADAPSINQIVDGALLHCATPSAVGTDAYVVALAVSPGTLVTGARYSFTPDVDNTGACTINFNSIGVKNIKLVDGTDPHNGAIQANAPALLQYDGTNFVLMNPNPTLTPSVTTLTVSGAATFNGAVTLGNAAGDAITVTGTATFAENVQINAAVTATGLATVGEITCTAANPEILGGDTNGITYISAGATKDLGGNILLYGDTHANGGDIIFRDDTTTELAFDASGSSWDFQANAITTTGALTCGTFTSTGIDDNSTTGEKIQIADDRITLTDGIVHSDDTGSLTISGGDTYVKGGQIKLYGSTHVSNARDIELLADGTAELHYNDDASTWDFQANAITTTGAITGATVTTTDRVSVNEALDEGALLNVSGSWTNIGGTTASGIEANPDITAINGTTLLQAGIWVSPILRTQDNSETVQNASSIHVSIPNIVKGATDTINSAQSLLVSGAPTEGTTNHAIKVIAGTTTVQDISCTDITATGDVSCAALTTTGAVDINSGAIDGTTIGASSAAAITGTTIVASTSIATAAGATITEFSTDGTMAGNSAVHVPTESAVKTYADSKVQTGGSTAVIEMARDLGGTTIASGGADLHTIAHGLGGTPDIIQAYIKCNDAGGDGGWAQNDEVFVSAMDWVTSSTSGGAAIYTDATNVYARISNSATPLQIPHKTTGTITTLDETKWDLYVNVIYFG